MCAEENDNFDHERFSRTVEKHWEQNYG